MMNTNSAQCPYCKTIKAVSRNMTYKCQGCGANIYIDNDGRIKKTTPPKR